MNKLAARIFVGLLTFVMAVGFWAVRNSYLNERRIGSETNNARVVQVPQGWQEIDMEGVVTLYLPANLKQRLLPGSTGRIFYNDQFQLGIFYGPSSSGTCAVHRNHAENKVAVTEIVIDRKAATISYRDSYAFGLIPGVSFTKGFNVCVPLAIDGVENLAISGDYSDPQAFETIDAIIKTMKIP